MVTSSDCCGWRFRALWLNRARLRSCGFCGFIPYLCSILAGTNWSFGTCCFPAFLTHPKLLRGCLDGILGKNSSWKGLANIGPGCPGKALTHYPWRDLKAMWKWHPGTWFSGGRMVGVDDLGGIFQLNQRITESPGLGRTLKSSRSNPQLQKRQLHKAHPTPGIFLIFNLGTSGEGNGGEIWSLVL